MPCAATTTATPLSGAALAFQRAIACCHRCWKSALRCAKVAALPASSCCSRAPSAVRHQRDVARVGLDVRIAGGVHIARERSSCVGTSSLRTKSAAAKLPRLSGLDFRVARLLQQHRQPADLQLGAGAHQQVGVARAGDQARPGLDLVRVLQRGGGHLHVDQLAAELLRQRAPLGLAGQHAQRRVRRRGAATPCSAAATRRTFE